MSELAKGDQEPTFSSTEATSPMANTAPQETLQHRTEELNQAIGVAEEAYQALKTNYLGIIKVFDQLIEARGHTVTGNAKRIAETTKKMTGLLSLSPEEEQHIVFAGFLYNIGKMLLPDHLISKPFVALKNDEKMTYKEATVKSADILSTIKSLKKTAFYIRYLHERFDGKGYPDGLVGEKIPLGSRIISLVADYENLQNGSLTGKKHEKAQAINFILDNRNSRYDPNLANLLIEGQNSGIQVTTALPQKESAPPQKAASKELKKELKVVSSNELMPAMILAEDLQTKAGISILSKGYEFTEEVISHIVKLEHSLKEALAISVYITQEKGKDDASNHAGG